MLFSGPPLPPPLEFRRPIFFQTHPLLFSEPATTSPICILFFLRSDKTIDHNTVSDFELATFKTTELSPKQQESSWCCSASLRSTPRARLPSSHTLLPSPAFPIVTADPTSRAPIASFFIPYQNTTHIFLRQTDQRSPRDTSPAPHRTQHHTHPGVIRLSHICHHGTLSSSIPRAHPQWPLLLTAHDPQSQSGLVLLLPLLPSIVSPNDDGRPPSMSRRPRGREP